MNHDFNKVNKSRAWSTFGAYRANAMRKRHSACQGGSLSGLRVGNPRGSIGREGGIFTPIEKGGSRDGSIQSRFLGDPDRIAIS